MADVDALVEKAMEQLSEIGDDTVNLTQEESAEFYHGVAHDCTTRARAIDFEIAQTEGADEDDDGANEDG